MKRQFSALVILAAATLTGCATEPPPKSNVSEEMLRKMLSGHVLVSTDPYRTGQREGLVDAMFFAEDGLFFQCYTVAGTSTDSGSGIGAWRVRTIPSVGAIGEYQTNHPDKARDDEYLFRPVKFDPATGTFTDFAPWKGEWIPFKQGHLQETWPAAVQERCPKLQLPDGVAINDAQTSIRYSTLNKQDPNAVLRNFE